MKDAMRLNLMTALVFLAVPAFADGFGNSNDRPTKTKTTEMSLDDPTLANGSIPATVMSISKGLSSALSAPLDHPGGLLSYSIIGTSGKSVPMLNSNNIWSGQQTFGDSPLWIEAYLPGSQGRTPAMSTATSSENFSSFISATRTSLNASKDQNLIADTALNVVDNTKMAQNSWARYSQTNITPASRYAQVFGEENSVENRAGDAADVDPFTTIYGSNPNAVYGLRLNSGVGRSSNLISALISLTSNGGKARHGFVFGADALDTSSGYASAISLGTNQGIDWYSAASNVAWRIVNNSNSGFGQIILGNNKFDLYLNRNNAQIHPISATETAVTIGYTLNFGYSGTSGNCTPTGYISVQIDGIPKKIPYC